MRPPILAACSVVTALVGLCVSAGASASAPARQAGTIADTTPPEVKTSVSPSATPQGWHNTDVTITFFCHDTSGVAECPTPIVVTQEGFNQVFSRTATDLFGNQKTETVTINLDRTPPYVSITDPDDNTTTTATSVVLTGDVSDALSGIVSATCNGQTGTSEAGAVTCDINLAPGRNAVVLFARDAAGNGVSRGVRITRAGTPTAVRINPSSRTMVIGESQRFTITDEFGTAPDDVTWTSSDANIVGVDTNGVAVARAAGQVTITATVDGLSAEATVTVPERSRSPRAPR